MAMRWEDEPWRKLYTRNTVSWKALPWQARLVLPQLVREVDDAGLLFLGRLAPAALAIALDIPKPVAAAALEQLTTPTEIDPDPPVILRDGVLVLRNFVEAQQARTSDRLRKATERARDRDKHLKSPESMSHGVTAVTDGHTESQHVTIRREEKRSDQDPASVPDGTTGVLIQIAPVERFDFDAIYARYPRKIGKADGLKRLRASVRSEADYESLKRALDQYLAYIAQYVTPGEKKFIKHFSTWAGCWRDFADQPPAEVTGQVSDLGSRIREAEERRLRGGEP